MTRGWRPALRIAWREALRARGRSALVLVMIGLPVMAIVALDTLGRTSDVSTVEGLSRTLGAADAAVTYEGPFGPVQQSPDLSVRSSEGPASGSVAVPDVAALRAVVGARARITEVRSGTTTVRTDLGLARPSASEVDLRDPMTEGLFDLVAGRLPAGKGEVVVSPRFADRGFPVGAAVTLQGGGRREVVGLVESTTTRGLDLVVGPPGATDLESNDVRTWLVSRPGGVGWASVRDLNQAGLFVLSRQVVADPPPASQVPVAGSADGLQGAEIAVLALVVAMALLEVVLLAGPAFAVGARRQQRSLALMAASGADPPHLRRVVLASGVVLGSSAAVLGSVLGVGAAWVARPVVQGASDTVLGPFEVSLRDISGIAACGLLSALLAAFLPAVLAARSDVVAVLARRRGQTRAGRRSPVVGGLLLAAGVVGAVLGARSAGGEVLITGAAILSVLGMVLLTPLALGLCGRLAGALPLPARFAVRDAARHRARTAPAVAAVAATVAGVVALGIGGSSDAAQNRALYTPSAPQGTGLVQACCPADQPPWSSFGTAVERLLPGARTTTVRGLDESGALQYRLEPDTGSWQGNLGASLLVGPESLGALRLSATDLQRSRRALAEGRVVVLGADAAPADAVTLLAESYDEDGVGTVRSRSVHPAVAVSAPGSLQPARAVLPAVVARTADLPVVTTAMLVRGVTLDQAAEDAVDEAVAGLDENASFYVERGFQDDSTRVVLLLLAAAGGVLVLGGTLTATFLALSDARPDFATMGAVGADPATRRWVAASYAGSIGLVGATLGAAVGFVPGVAVTFPLTASSWAGPEATDSTGSALPDHFLDVPWLLVLGIVVVLPLLTAAVVGLTARSQLPFRSRLS